MSPSLSPAAETELREEHEFQAQHGNSLSHAPYTNKRILITDEQHHAGHLQKMLLSGHTNKTDLSAFQNHSQPFIGRYETSSPDSLPIHVEGMTKQASSSNLSIATVLQERALHRDYSSSGVPEDAPPSKPSAGVPSEVREKPIATQPRAVERHHPLAVGIQQGAGSRTPSGPSDDVHPAKRRRPPGGGRPPGEPPEQTVGGRGGGRGWSTSIDISKRSTGGRRSAWMSWDNGIRRTTR